MAGLVRLLLARAGAAAAAAAGAAQRLWLATEDCGQAQSELSDCVCLLQLISKVASVHWVIRFVVQVATAHIWSIFLVIPSFHYSTLVAVG